MSLSLKPAAMGLVVMFAMLGLAGTASAAGVYSVLPFQNTGASPPSHYGNGSYPRSELLQASDGNFYGTTQSGGAGLCRSGEAPRSVIGCGTIFRINAATGAETVLFSFPYDAANNSAPEGAYPSAGLIQGKDGALYGVAYSGGIPGCDGQFGCGTLFRITTTGVFTLLHQFCGAAGCPSVDEGAAPAYHLVQTADGTLYGTTTYDGDNVEYGTLFSASTSGAVTTLENFRDYSDGGAVPTGALLVGTDGSTLYGATDGGGTSGDGTVFSYGAAGLTNIHSFDTQYATPSGALIFGPGGLLYGSTSAGLQPGTLYSLSITGDGFAVDTTLSGTLNTTSLLLGSNGMIYGTMIGVLNSNRAGGVFAYNPTTEVLQAFVKFGTATGGYPEGALIEGKDHYLYGTNAMYGGSNSFGPAEGTLYRIGPPLP